MARAGRKVPLWKEVTWVGTGSGDLAAALPTERTLAEPRKGNGHIRQMLAKVESKVKSKVEPKVESKRRACPGGPAPLLLLLLPSEAQECRGSPGPQVPRRESHAVEAQAPWLTCTLTRFPRQLGPEPHSSQSTSLSSPGSDRIAS